MGARLLCVETGLEVLRRGDFSSFCNLDGEGRPQSAVAPCKRPSVGRLKCVPCAPLLTPWSVQQYLFPPPLLSPPAPPHV